MNTARILDLAIAIGAGSPAARPASQPGGKFASRGHVLPLFTPDAPYPHSGTSSLAAVTQP